MPERYLGSTLGNYRIDTLIGTGGFAWVYKAYDTALDIPVAIKILKPQLCGEEMFVTRFRREAATAAKLRHPNIVKIYAVGHEQGAVYFAMDYLPGKLADRLSVMSVLPEPLLLRLGMDVADALGYAHAANVIHRDIKTDNILFDEQGNAVVADFGIARALAAVQNQTGTNLVLGTPHYFAPEQARGLALDGRADIYSLGVTMFRAATGRLPFMGNDWYETARRHVEEQPPSVRDFNRAISPELDAIILQCLEKEPDARFPTGEVLRDSLAALRDVHEGEPHRTMQVPVLRPRRKTGPIRRLVKRVQASPGRRWVAAALLIAGGFLSAHALAGRIGGGDDAGAPALVAPVGQGGPGAPAAAAIPPPIPVATHPASLTVIAPPGARLVIGGKFVGYGRWTSDTLPPEVLKAIATVATFDGCPSQRDSAVTTLLAGSRDTIRLNPVPCGRLSIVQREPALAEASFRVLRMGTQVAAGPLPLANPLVLPEGLYDVEVNPPPPSGGRACSRYHDLGRSIRAATTETITFVFDCDPV